MGKGAKQKEIDILQYRKSGQCCPSFSYFNIAGSPTHNTTSPGPLPTQPLPSSLVLISPFMSVFPPGRDLRGNLAHPSYTTGYPLGPANDGDRLMAAADEEPSHLDGKDLYIRVADFLDEHNVVAICRADFPLAGW
jgi:hypothetical protein